MYKKATQQDVTDFMNANWWKVPRRTRNRIMLDRYNKSKNRGRYNPYRDLDKKTRKGLHEQFDYVDRIYDWIRNWQPPENSYDKPWLNLG